VATDPHRPPLSFLDPRGNPAGFEVDVAQALAKQAGWTVEIVPTTTDGLLRGAEGQGILAGLDRGDWDLVLSSVEGSNQLLENHSLSRAYLNLGPVVVTAVGAPAPPLDARWPGLVGVVEGSPGASEVRKSPVPTWRVRNYFDPTSALEDLADGNLTAAVVGTIDVAAGLYDNERLQTVLKAGSQLTQDHGLVAVTRKDDPRLADLNQALEALDQSGTLESLRRKWFLP
jgi:ABC-type amino acid transport substrate-binding protein